MRAAIYAIIPAACLAVSLALAGQTGESQPGAAASGSPGRIGTVVSVEKDSLRVTLKSAEGKVWSVDLDPAVRIMRAVSLNELAAGDYLHGIMSGTSGDGLIRRGLVNARGTRRETGKPAKAAARSSHVAGEIISVDYKKRMVTIGDGETRRTVGVAERARFNAFVGIDSLKPGEALVLLAQGPAADAPVKTVIVRSPALERR